MLRHLPLRTSWPIYIIGAVLILAAICFAGGWIATLVTCRGIPRHAEHFFTAITSIFATGDLAAGSGHVDGCTATRTWAQVTTGLIATLVTITAAIGGVRWHLYKQTPAYLRRQILRRPEIAGGPEVMRTVGPKITIDRGKRVRPSLTKPRPEQVAWLLGFSLKVAVWLSMEDACLVYGPPRSGKGLAIFTAHIIEAPGAVVTTSSRGDNMEATILARSKIGPVYVFDPEQVTGRQTTITWSPIRGCEDGKTAQARARVLVSASGLKADGNNAEWAGKAAEILQTLLHAAAIGNVSLAELHTWTKSPTDAARALPILDEVSTLGWGPMLRTVLNEDDRTRANKWFGVSSSLSALDVPDIRQVFEPGPGDRVFDPEAFLRERGTLYLIAELRGATETSGGVGVFFSMILDDIVKTAHRIAMRAPGGRLDPPVSLILDEIASIHPWEGLPAAMAAGSGEGIQVTAGFQSLNQARAGWGDEGAGTIWESATRKIVLGSASDPSDLRAIEELLGERTELTWTESYGENNDGSYSQNLRDKPVLSRAEIRRLPEENALLLAGRARPILVDLVPHPQRAWATLVTASKKWHQDHPPAIGDEPLAETYTAPTPQAA
ncbi:Type IV secretory pathway, VirD4 component, TraG/TraD family ATPase [Micrococcales bacterium KH10]|nr:Type IV secretory pathway, VirD4 component, TraG/TraD family ATPase [Micrococcales bacterium KH10]